MNPLIVPCAGLRDHVKKQVLWRKLGEGNITKSLALSGRKNLKLHGNANLSKLAIVFNPKIVLILNWKLKFKNQYGYE